MSAHSLIKNGLWVHSRVVTPEDANTSLETPLSRLVVCYWDCRVSCRKKHVLN